MTRRCPRLSCLGLRRCPRRRLASKEGFEKQRAAALSIHWQASAWVARSREIVTKRALASTAIERALLRSIPTVPAAIKALTLMRTQLMTIRTDTEIREIIDKAKLVKIFYSKWMLSGMRLRTPLFSAATGLVMSFTACQMLREVAPKLPRMEGLEKFALR
jgi:hypothetical protein